jgi:segregation and condensation protein B
LTSWDGAHDPSTSTQTRWRPSCTGANGLGRLEAAIFASKEPVSRQVLARVVAPNCNLDWVIEDIRRRVARSTLRPRRRRRRLASAHAEKQFADAIHLAMGGPRLQPLSRNENLVLTAIGYFQPITRGELSQLFGKEISRDVIGQLRAFKFIVAGPRSPQPGAPYTT